MKRIFRVTVLFGVIGLTACSGGIKRSWNNVSAYYNTFYNAKQQYAAGMRAVQAQPLIIETDQLVPVYPSPTGAGSASFSEAAANAEQLLLRHAQSVWVDDALLLLGKTYFHQKKYYQSIEQLENLLALEAEPALQLQAIFWKGRALYELTDYARGVSFLETALNDESLRWEPSTRAKVQAIVAQHYAAQNKFSEAQKVLGQAIPALRQREDQSRARYLQAQLLQLDGRYQQALSAYTAVADGRPPEGYLFAAKIGQAQMAARLNEPEGALQLYDDMISSERFRLRRPEIQFYKAQTYEQTGAHELAIRTYKRILGDNAGTTAGLRGQAYQKLGDLYGRQRGEYRLAAAYYDSAAQVRAGDGAPRTQTAAAYGEYVQLKNEIRRTQQLITLSTLNDEELSVALERLRQQARKVAGGSEQSINPLQNERGRLPGKSIGLQQQRPEVASFGFLNYKNAAQVAQQRARFRAQWGPRPPVDNWRRQAAIAANTPGQDVEKNGRSEQNNARESSAERSAIRRADVPRNDEARRQLQEERAQAQYQLGSLFYLQLNQPDSALSYYNRVLEGQPTDALRAQTLFSAYRLSNSINEKLQAQQYRRELIQRYAGSSFARRLQAGVAEENQNAPIIKRDSTAMLRQRIAPLVESATLNAVQIEQLRALAVEFSQTPIADEVYYRALKEHLNNQPKVVSNTDSTGGLMAKEQLTRSQMVAEFVRLFPESTHRGQVQLLQNRIMNPPKDEPLRCEAINQKPAIAGGMNNFLKQVQFSRTIREMALSGNIMYQMLISADGSVKEYTLLSEPTGLGIEEAFELAFKEHLQFETVQQNGKAVQALCSVRFPISN